MIDLNDYLDPVSVEEPTFSYLGERSSFSHSITIHDEGNAIANIQKFKVAIIGIREGRNSPSTGSTNSPNRIRQHLYKMSSVPGRLKIIDMGDLKNGRSFNDTISALTDIITHLLNNNVLPLLIGGNSTIALGINRALSGLNIHYTLTTIDSHIDYITDKQELSPFNFLNTIFRDRTSTLHHFINIGYQTYMNDQRVINLFLKNKSELIRVGDARRTIHLSEPLLRDSDVAIFDMSSVRQSDAPGSLLPSPNGFYGEEICLLGRYAGISDRLKVFSLLDIDIYHDVRDQTSQLAAQIIWFFLEGFTQKNIEDPLSDEAANGSFIKYHVNIPDLDRDFVFIKSSLTDRWWVKLPTKNGGHTLLSCSFEDYLKASQNELSDRLLKGSTLL